MPLLSSNVYAFKQTYLIVTRALVWHTPVLAVVPTSWQRVTIPTASQTGTEA